MLEVIFEVLNEETGIFDSMSLPGKWEVCPNCKGGGTNRSHHLGSFTRDEMDDLGPEFMEDYRSGVYDKPCEVCKGQRVVAVPDEEQSDPALIQRYLDQKEENRRIDLEDYAERRTLALMSGESLRDWK